MTRPGMHGLCRTNAMFVFWKVRGIYKKNDKARHGLCHTNAMFAYDKFEGYMYYYLLEPRSKKVSYLNKAPITWWSHLQIQIMWTFCTPRLH